MLIKHKFLIPSSIVVTTGEPLLLDAWLPSVIPMLSKLDQLIIIDSIGSNFSGMVSAPCEVILVQVTRYSPTGEWGRMLNFGYRLTQKELVYQFDSDKHIVDAVRFRESSETLHMSHKKALVIGSILDHPTKGEDYSEGRKQVLDFSICWGGNISFHRDNLLFYDDRFLSWGGEDREWAFRMIHEKRCSVVWNEQAKVVHVPHKLQVDHNNEEAHRNDDLIERLNKETLEKLK